MRKKSVFSGREIRFAEVTDETADIAKEDNRRGGVEGVYHCGRKE